MVSISEILDLLKHPLYGLQKLKALIDDIISDIASLGEILEYLFIEAQHETLIFPDNPDEYVTLEAGAVNNEYSSWIEVEDNNAVKLSSKFASENGHISSAIVESTDTKDKVYLFEFAFSDVKTLISKHRFASGDIKHLSAVQQARVRGKAVPKGEKVFYRMTCETGGAKCTLHFRYHYHG
ncbi:unnamed protein product [marine sediment metagenome]|uniref:Uncharacterized protein n=1 Tax=marine sediment metagenome TaxID=412755 RepID=X1L6E8_9ZZZZ